MITAAEKGALDVIEPGINGFFVGYGDPDQIESCLTKLTSREVRAETSLRGARWLLALAGLDILLFATGFNNIF